MIEIRQGFLPSNYSAFAVFIFVFIFEKNCSSSTNYELITNIFRPALSPRKRKI